MPEPASVVIVEDDRSVREMLAAVLGHEGYRVVAHEDGDGVAEDPAALQADVVVLDIGLPGIDGIEVCRQLRASGRGGSILMLTARGDVRERVRGLDAGADDYLPKPFALDELLARVRALVRRGGVPSPTPQAVDESSNAPLVLGDLEVDPGRRVVERAGRAITLTKLEFDLLELLVRNSPLVLDRATLHERVWGYDQDLGSNSLEVFVSQLRRKIEADGRSRLIHTVRGVGYCARLDGVPT